MGKQSGGTRTSAKTAPFSSFSDVKNRFSVKEGKSDVYLDDYAKEFAELEQEYGIKMDGYRVEHSPGAIAHYDDKDNVIIVDDKMPNWTWGKYDKGGVSRSNVGAELDKTGKLKVIAAHEFAHALSRASLVEKAKIDSFDEYKRKMKGSGFKVAELKSMYPKYVERKQKIIAPISSTLRKLKPLHDKLAAIHSDYKENKDTRNIISKYASHSFSEFVSEAFAYRKVYGRGNPYANKVFDAINSYYKKK